MRHPFPLIFCVLHVSLLLAACAGGQQVTMPVPEPSPSAGLPTAIVTTTPRLTATNTETLTPSPTYTAIPTPSRTPTFTALPLNTVLGEFSGQRAYQDVIYQVEQGARTVGSPANQAVGDWIAVELEKNGWQVEIQETTYLDKPVRNIIGKWGQGRPWVVLGAHYDTRLVTDKDPDPAVRPTPGPGANDGASGVAVLLELARTLPIRMESLVSGVQTDPGRTPPEQIWLVFFDNEDNGKIPGWEYIMGSRAFVNDLENLPQAAVIVDMIGDKDLTIYYEKNSDTLLRQEIWRQAGDLGYGEQFIQTEEYAILDDHIPFLEAGIPAVELIDFVYPYWHTSADTIDKVSAESLQAVGDTLTAWLVNGSQFFARP